MTARQPFSPAYGSGQSVAPAATSASVQINASNNQVRIVNTGAAIAFVRTFSQASQPATVATAADMPIPPNMAVTITKDLSHDRLAHISAAGTTLQVITGEGW